MIDLDIPQFLAAFLLISAAVVGLGGIREQLSERRRARAARRDVLRCRICGAAYRKEGPNAVQSCPECGSPNHLGRDRRLG